MTETAARGGRVAPHSGAISSLAPLEGFRPDIQVLRGVAVLAVVLYHAQVVLPGGFVGVDMFFVISGFVIGRVLLTSLGGADKVSFRQFYVRRSRRLLPALAVTLTTVVLLSPLLAPIGAVEETPRTGAAAALFSANLYLYSITGGGYFAPAAELNPLLHTWSLSVEEQFYFITPLLLVGAWAVGRRRGRGLAGARAMTVALLASSLALCVAFTTTASVGPLDGPRFAFFSPVTRAWEFAVGLGLVLLPATWFADRSLRVAGATLGVILVGVSMLTFSDATEFPGSAALLPVVGTALLIHAATGYPKATTHRTVARWQAPLAWMGDVSYSWYLWHWPLIVFAGALWPGAGRVPLVAAAAVSLLPAWASYELIERRLRATARTRTRPTVGLAAMCIAAPLAATVLVLPISGVVTEQPVVQAFEESQLVHADLVEGCRGNEPLGERDPQRCRWGPEDASMSVVLIGDSNAGHFSEAFIGAAGPDRTVRIATMSSCPISDVILERDGDAGFAADACREFVTGSVDTLVADPPDTVVIANGTDMYAVDGRFTLVDPTTGERSTGDERPRAFQQGLERVAQRLSEAGSRVVILNTVPKPGDWDPRECSNLTLMIDASRCAAPAFRMSEWTVLQQSNAIEDRAAAQAGIDAWSFNDRICPDDTCRGERDGRLIWRDGGHITVAESSALTGAVIERLDEGRT